MENSEHAPDSSKEHYCEFNDHGQACSLVGHLSQSTNGTGPWYCRQHFARIMGWPQLEAMSMEKPLSIAIDELTEDLREPYRSQAKTLQARERSASLEPMSEVDKRVNRPVPRHASESEHDWSMRCRDFVLATVGKFAMREPGQD